VQCLRLSYIQ